MLYICTTLVCPTPDRCTTECCLPQLRQGEDVSRSLLIFLIFTCHMLFCRKPRECMTCNTCMDNNHCIHEDHLGASTLLLCQMGKVLLPFSCIVLLLISTSTSLSPCSCSRRCRWGTTCRCCVASLALMLLLLVRALLPLWCARVRMLKANNASVNKI